MSARFRQKACHACADSKRKCDKQVPECQRCMDRDVDCFYPKPPRRRRRQPQVHSNHGLSLSAVEPQQCDHVDDLLDIEAWDDHVDFDFNSILSAEQPFSDMPLSFPELSAPRDLGATLFHKTAPAYSSGQKPTWFLQDEAWRLSHANCDQSATCNSVVDLEPFIGAVEQQLRSWVDNGYSGFIHHRLYEDRMPASLQDAYITAASYLKGTPTAKRKILQIAEERSLTLVEKGKLELGNSSKCILDQMAHVHALFVYIYIRLFDGSVRTRCSAEKQIPALRAQLVILRDVARQYQGEGVLTQHRALAWNNVELETEYQACQEMWRLWILTESIRRSYLLIDTTLNIYEAMSRGWAECTGAMTLTVRDGLWEAESSVKWFRQCCDKSPLLVPSLEPEGIISSYDSKEIDEFAKMMWTYVVGVDRIQCWVDSSG